jgi:hypothetical protein
LRLPALSLIEEARCEKHNNGRIENIFMDEANFRKQME